MSYQIKRKQRVTERLELADENGNVVYVLEVKLDADDIAKKVHRKYTDLIKVLSETTEIKRKAESGEEVEGCIEKLGNAVVLLFEAVFGTDDTKKILDFYDSRYIEMCREVIPFITEVIIPKIQKINDENRKKAKMSYDRKKAWYKK